MRFDVLSASRDLGSLTKSLESTDTNWGGGGGQEIFRVCGSFAHLVNGVENYDQMVCTIHNITLRTTQPAARIWAFEQIGDRTDKVLTYARVEYAMERAELVRQTNGYGVPNNPLYRAEVLAYLGLEGVNDRNMARRFQWAFQEDEESISIIDGIAARSRAWLEEAIKADPLNLLYMKELERVDAIWTSADEGTINHDLEQTRRFNVRRAMAQPFDANVWSILKRNVRETPQTGQSKSRDDFYINAIAYSDHKATKVADMLERKLKMFELYQIVLRYPPDYEIMPYSEVISDFICPIARLERLLRVRCEVEENCATTSIRDESILADVLNKIRTEDICRAEREAPIEKLYYEPIKTGFDAVYAGIENRE